MSSDHLPREDLLSRLALRLVSPPTVMPRLGLRFSATPDLPDEETAEWRRGWHGDERESKAAK